MNYNLALKCWIDNTDVAILWEFSKISVVCCRCLDRSGRGMLPWSVSVSIPECLGHAENEKHLPYLVRDQALVKTGQQLCYLKSPSNLSH